MKDSKKVIGHLAIACSQNYHGSIIYWDMNDFDSWLIIGGIGLTFCHSKDDNPDPSVRNPYHIYGIIGVDEI